MNNMNVDSQSIEIASPISGSHISSMENIKKATEGEIENSLHSCTLRKYSNHRINEDNMSQSIGFNLQEVRSTAVVSPACQFELEANHSSYHARTVADNFNNSSEEIRVEAVRKQNSMKLPCSDLSNNTEGDAHVEDEKAHLDICEDEDAEANTNRVEKEMEHTYSNRIPAEKEALFTSDSTFTTDSVNVLDSAQCHQSGASKPNTQIDSILNQKSEITIQSEQQRLHREANISVPYYIPKNHTIQEFLGRRTIIQPQPSSKCTAIIKNVLQKCKSMKMSTEELKQYADFLEIRATEAREFYSSIMNGKTDDNAEVVNRNDEDVIQNKCNNKKSLIAEAYCETSSNPNEKLTNSNIKDMEVTQSKSLEEKSITKNLREHGHTIEKNIPNIDSSTATSEKNVILSGQNFDHEPAAALLKKITKLPTRPVVTGEPDKFFDLSNGDWIEKEAIGYEALIKRLLSNKKSSALSCGTLSAEHDKLKLKKISFELNDKSTLDNKPRITKSIRTSSNYFEMQRYLKDLMEKQRENDLQRKSEQQLSMVEHLNKNGSSNSDDSDDNSCSNGEYNGDADTEDDCDDVEEEKLSYRSKKLTSMPICPTEICSNIVNSENKDAIYSNKYVVSDVDKTERNKDAEFVKINNEIVNNLTRIPLESLAIENVNKKNKRIIIRPIDDDEDDDIVNKNQVDKINYPGFAAQHSNGEKQPPTATRRSPINKNSNAKVEATDLFCYNSGQVNSSRSLTKNVLMSQVPKSVCNVDETSEYDELMALCSGTFDQTLYGREANDDGKAINTELFKNALNEANELQQPFSRLKNCNVKKPFAVSDDENTNSESETTERASELTKDSNKNYSLLTLSKQEIVDNNDKAYANDDTTNLKTSDICSVKDLLIKSNNENKRQKKIAYADFIESEAELSDIEMFTGSSDEEDNEDLDRYDMELGDEDEYDPEQLQNELVNVNVNQMMKEDAQRIRKLCDQFVNNSNDEDGERLRQFRWINKENNSLTTQEVGGNLDYNSNGISVDFDVQQNDKRDELLELKWRQMCYEREQILETQRVRGYISNGNVLKLHRSTTTNSRKIRIINGKSCTQPKAVKSNINKPAMPFLISKQLDVRSIKSSRGSFLKCDQDTLNKLATVTKSNSSNHNTDNYDNNGIHSNKMIPITSENSKRFVFSALTTIEQAKFKRKSNTLSATNSSVEEHNDENEKCTEHAIGKRLKLEPLTRPRCQIDKLLDTV